jgi:hypothetical protein|tara:strand:- start:19 stop:198 length:180 start_codon:yes stop_codon:yes gene_type:complete
MSYEDLYYEIHEQMEKLGLRSKFDKELEKLRNDPKWEHKEVRDRWEAARTIIITKYNKK